MLRPIGQNGISAYQGYKLSSSEVDSDNIFTVAFGARALEDTLDRCEHTNNYIIILM